MERRHETAMRIATTPEEVRRGDQRGEIDHEVVFPHARVQPGPDGLMVGGTMSHLWGPKVEGSMVIEVWEPNRRLRVSAGAVAVDYFIDSKEGITTLRLVHSGFGSGTEWDDEYEGSKKGWPIFFDALKHALKPHRGESAYQVSITMPVNASPPEQWQRILGSQLNLSREVTVTA